MIEPIYTYVKGQGWVINPYPRIEMRCGTIVSIEPRPPNRGEAYSYCYKDEDTQWTPEGVLDLDFWASQYKDEKYHHLSIWNRTEHDDRLYVTFVRV